VVESAANHLLGILNDILDFSKIEAGKITIRPVRFKPIESAEEVIKLFLSKASEKNISLSLTTLPPIPDYLNGDDGRIRQILSNFVSNAIKFTDNDGRISVNITGSHAAADTFMITFSVQDSGAGISEALRPKLFEPFTQADPSNTRKHGGAGLGLAICKRLVELMKGEIGFESSEGNGSTFWINIPLSSDLTAMTPIISHEKT
jgi:signal transduction histidine kinase